jgi:hypothetical protein
MLSAIGHYSLKSALETLFNNNNNNNAIIFNITNYFCSRVVLEKPTGSQLVKEFPAFYGTRKFITAFTSARQLSLS